MDRNEILEQNKKAAPADEGVAHQANRARTIASVVMVVLLAGLLLYNLLANQPTEALQAVLWAFLGTEAMVRHQHEKTKTSLVAGLAGLLASVLFAANYLMQTWPW